MQTVSAKIVRKQISVYKFLRIKNSHDSKRVVVFIANSFTIVKPVEAYLHKNCLYVLEGQIKPMAGSLWRSVRQCNTALHSSGTILQTLHTLQRGG